MLKLRMSSRFKRDVKLCEKRGYDIELLKDVLRVLQKQETLPPKHKDHALTGDMKAFRECHIQPDWLLIYAVDIDTLVLLTHSTGSHADLF